MGQIQDLEQRILAAFDRISTSAEALAARATASEPPSLDPQLPETPAPEPTPAPEMAMDASAMPGDDLAALQMALDEERMANAQLTERLRVVGDLAAETEATLRAEVDGLTRALDAQGLDAQRLSATVTQLREDLRRLREAAEQGIVDPSLINKAMLAELEALRATRAAETHEMNDILSALVPILEAEEARPHA